MATSKAKTVSAYLAELPADRRRQLASVRKLVNASLPAGYDEGMLYGMVAWYIPLAKFSDTYNRQPLGVAGLAAHKRTNTLYLFGPYADPAQRKLLEDECAAIGKTFDMGKSCLHFSSIDDLPLNALRAVLGMTSPAALIAQHEKAHAARRAAGRFRKYKSAVAERRTTPRR
jgi:hypothetical protein